MARKQVDEVQQAMDEIAEAKKAGKTELSINARTPEIVKAACEVTTLTDLRISGQLKAVPPEIGNLTELTDLNIEGNELTALPPEIGKCTKLTAFRAYSNKLVTLPDTIGSWSKLSKVVLWSNEMTHLPEAIGGWVSCTELSFKRNKLRSVPDGIGKLAALEELELDNNELETLPKTLGGMAKLTKLTLGSNKFTTFPIGVLDLPALRELFLQRNKITAIPDEIARMTTLELLELKENEITKLPAGLFGLKQLSSLDLSRNKIVSVPKDIGKLESLEELTLDGNPIEGITEEAIAIGKDGVFKALGLLKEQVIEGDLPPADERAAIVKAAQPRIDGFVREAKKKSHASEILPKIVEFITGKTNVVPPIRRDDVYGFSHLAEKLAPFAQWSFIDRRILTFCAQGAFYYRQPGHTYLTGYHDEFYQWLKPFLEKEAANEDVFSPIAQALRAAGCNEDVLVRASLNKLDSLITRDDGSATSFGRWLLGQMKTKLDLMLEVAADDSGVRSGLVGLLVRNDLATLTKVADKLIVVEPSSSGETHLPCSTYDKLCAADPVKYTPMVLEALPRTGCIGCQAEVAKILAERCGPSHRARSYEIALQALTGITERRNKEERLWFSFDGAYGDGIPSYVDWFLKTYGAEGKAAIVKFAEDTKIFDLDVAEAISKHLGQDGIEALAEGLEMTVEDDDIAAHFRRMFAMLAPLDWSAHYDKAWELAHSEFKNVRQTACLALSRLDPAIVLPKALAMFDEKKAHVREAGVLIATLLPDDPARKQLDALLADETSDDVRDLVVAQRYGGSVKASVAEIAKRVASAKERGKLAKPVAKWVDEKKLPPVFWKGGKKLDADTVRFLLHRQTRLNDIGPETEARAAYALIDRDKSGPFAAKLLALAVKNGGISAKTRFALSVIGLVGGDAVIDTLEETAIDTHNENAATTLGLLGSESAARALDRIMKVFRIKYPNVREAAQDAFDSIAQAMGISRFELADSMLPDFGFKKGAGTIALGKVKAKVTIGSDRKLEFHDAAGKLIKSPGKGLTGKAKEVLETLRDDFDGAARALKSSLEYYMVAGRRWPAAKWKTFILGNPLASAFAQSLVWTSGTATFRVDDKGALVDANGKTVKLGAEVALVHPLDLDDATREAWRAAIAAAELEPPFAQMTRPLFVPKVDDRTRTRSFEFEDKELEGLTFKSRAERLGWRRGSVVDGGGVSAYRKLFERHQIEAFIGTANLSVQSYDGGEVTLEELFFVKAGSIVTGSYTYDEPRDDGDARLMKLGDVPPIVYSETIADLNHVTREVAEA